MGTPFIYMFIISELLRLGIVHTEGFGCDLLHLLLGTGLVVVISGSVGYSIDYVPCPR